MLCGSYFRIIQLYAEAPQLLFLPAIYPPSFSLAKSAEHLWREEYGLQERACGEAARERVEEFGCAGRVVEPPNVSEDREAVDVDVVRRDEF